jgi:hypothetical protein
MTVDSKETAIYTDEIAAGEKNKKRRSCKSAKKTPISTHIEK